jgi:undecaprenyl-diphosphatase
MGPRSAAGIGVTEGGWGVDWTIFHWLNGLLLRHDLIGDEVADFTIWSPVLAAVAVGGLWLAGRPGTVSRWKFACASALASAALALLANQVIATLWSRARPTDAHPGEAHLHFVSPSADPSFPSDHAAAAFAIAFAVLFVSRRAGAWFLVGAAAIGFSRIVVGLHYPGDVLAGGAVGFVAAWAVDHVARRPLVALVQLVSRLTDPLLRPVWRAAESRLVSRRS